MQENDDLEFLCSGNEGGWEYEDPGEVQRISVGGGLEAGAGE
jgi:hypothetical protein